MTVWCVISILLFRSVSSRYVSLVSELQNQGRLQNFFFECLAGLCSAPRKSRLIEQSYRVLI